MDKIFESKKNKDSQVALLSISIIFLAVDTGFLVFQYTSGTVGVLIASLVFLVPANILNGWVYDVRLEGDLVFISNLWGRKELPVAEFMDVSQVNFYIYYPLNPYIRFTFKNGYRVVTTVSDPVKVYMGGGVKNYLMDLKKKIVS